LEIATGPANATHITSQYQDYVLLGLSIFLSFPVSGSGFGKFLSLKEKLTFIKISCLLTGTCVGLKPAKLQRK